MPTRPSEPELQEFLTRGVAEVVGRDELAAVLRSGERRLRVKQGFDPTSRNLHLGHAAGLRKLRRFAQWGHEIVLIVGDWTTQIGDPTDKDLSRPMRSRDEVMANAQTYIDQFHLVVPRENTRIVLQDEWFAKFGLRDVIELTSRFTVQQMLAREEFRKRQTAGTAIPIKDILYPLLQAYDSIAIEADLELGGTDQYFNLLAGRELQEQLGQRPQFVFTVHLLEGLDGNKMSKSIPRTAIWLLDPPAEMYGKVMSIHDDLMPHYFEWATDLPLEEVRDIVGGLERGTLHPRDAKQRLARQIVTELHSAADAERAAEAFTRMFREGAAPPEVPTQAAKILPDPTIERVLVHVGLTKSYGEAKRNVAQGGVSVNDVKATPGMLVDLSRETLLRVGPRRFLRVTWEAA